LGLAVGNDGTGRKGLTQLLACRRRQPGKDFEIVDTAVLHAVETQRVAAGGNDAVELGLAANI